MKVLLICLPKLYSLIVIHLKFEVNTHRHLRFNTLKPKKKTVSTSQKTRRLHCRDQLVITVWGVGSFHTFNRERKQYIRNMYVRNIMLYRSRLHNTSNAFNNLTSQILLHIYYINYIYTYVHYYPLKLQMRSIVRKETILCSAESRVPSVMRRGTVRK
jgi:hypothetical protein